MVLAADQEDKIRRRRECVFLLVYFSNFDKMNASESGFCLSFYKWQNKREKFHQFRPLYTIGKCAFLLDPKL